MSWTDRTERTEELIVKDAFAKRYKKIFEAKYDTFMESNKKYLRRAIRINTLKARNEIADTLRAQGWTLVPVPWCAQGYWIEGERLDIGNLLEHQLGHLYIQDPASMLPVEILRPQPGERVLDMCAAPGSKTSQMAAHMQNRGIIVANDADASRLAPLGVNLQRLGVANTVITRKDAREYKKYSFDKILLDAPCSGTGTIRRSLKALTQFNPQQLHAFHKLQYRLLLTGYAALVSGGTMTYSTCSIDPLENECVIDAFLNAHPEAELVDITVNIQREPNILTHPETGSSLHTAINKCLRIHPYTNDTEGFFVAHIRKP